MGKITGRPIDRNGKNQAYRSHDCTNEINELHDKEVKKNIVQSEAQKSGI